VSVDFAATLDRSRSLGFAEALVGQGGAPRVVLAYWSMVNSKDTACPAFRRGREHHAAPWRLITVIEELSVCSATTFSDLVGTDCLV
jgi:hypothetical protein